jgi:predicted SAM-dependent methyltransferase
LIGAGGTSLPGWRTTDGDILDLRNRGHFANKWKPNSRAAFLAEHVWEHLTPVDAITAVNICFEFLKPGGRLRIAVPDGWHPDPGYIERVRPGGSGPGCDDHKVLFTYESLGKLLESAGFEVQLLEYWDENRHFHQAAWSAEDGPIRRSARTDSRNAHGQLNYTSLIVDAIKPLPRSRVNQLLDRLRRKWLSKFAPFTHAIGQIRS